MHIKLKNKKLILNDYKIKCAIGKTGILKKKREGDLATPKGRYSFTKLMYRKDRVRNLRSHFKKIPIKKNMGWCDDVTSNQYNKLIHFPFDYGAEKLFRKDNIYDIILVTSYNSNPVKKNRGSAIFLHIAKNNFQKTKGCIAISKRDMRKILKNINNKTKIII
tara:strand:+ start:1336 stop:1824 length:489 start_codon:yes stop_codon:yes gene_type:complete